MNTNTKEMITIIFFCCMFFALVGGVMFVPSTRERLIQECLKRGTAVEECNKILK